MTTIRIAGIALLIIGGLFMYELFLLSEYSNKIDFDFVSKSEKLLDRLKICGFAQILLLIISGILFSVSDNSDEINDLKKRITKLENNS